MDARGRHRRRRYLGLLLGTACLLGVLLCGIGAFAVRGGMLSPPAVRLHIGAIGIEAGLSAEPECPPHCEWQEPTSGQRIYSVWFVSATTDAEGERRQARLLYAQPMR